MVSDNSLLYLIAAVGHSQRQAMGNRDSRRLPKDSIGGLPLGIPRRKTELLHREGEGGIDITPGGNEGAQVSQDGYAGHDVSFLLE